jgi:1-deoxy-D-xylulose-5-phosphate reductoisomerase
MAQGKGKKRVLVLGSSGSIGSNTLEVIRSFPELFEVVGLVCRRSKELLARQIREFKPAAVALADAEEAFDLPGITSGPESPSCYCGPEGLLRLIEDVDADVVVNGISGSAGLLPSLKVLEKGTDLAIANKETIVMAGPLITAAARKSGARLIPLDSEHGAVYNLLAGLEPDKLGKIVLTASGGAFRDLNREQLKKVTLSDALKHPNWAMGPKNTIDSATLANKGLEVIEAHYLFEVEVMRIEVLIHPQSIVHSLIQTRDGFYYAQLSQPDMRLVIQNALTSPEMRASAFGFLPLAGQNLSFRAVDEEKYPLLPLAYLAAERGGAYPAVYNAANEAAIESFLAERISFLHIAAAVEEAMQADYDYEPHSIAAILDVHRQARQRTMDFIRRQAG